jgi:hypothetical protein
MAQDWEQAERMKKEKAFDIIDFEKIVKTDCRIHQQMYVESFKKQPQVMLGREDIISYTEVRPGFLQLEKGSLEKFNDRVREKILSTPNFAVHLQRLMEDSLERLERACLDVEATIYPEMAPESEGVSRLYDEVTTYMSFSELTYGFPYAELKRIIEDCVPQEQAGKIYFDIQLPKRMSHYLLFHTRLLGLAEAALTSGEQPNYEKFIREYAFLSTVLIEPTPYEDPVLLKKAVEGLLEKYGYDREKIRAEKRAVEAKSTETNARREAAINYLFDRCDNGPTNRVLLAHLVDLISDIVDMEEVKHYWQLRTLRNFREIIDSCGLDRKTVTIQDLCRCLDRRCLERQV